MLIEKRISARNLLHSLTLKGKERLLLLFERTMDGAGLFSLQPEGVWID